MLAYWAVHDASVDLYKQREEAHRRTKFSCSVMFDYLKKMEIGLMRIGREANMQDHNSLLVIEASDLPDDAHDGSEASSLACHCHPEESKR